MTQFLHCTHTTTTTPSSSDTHHHLLMSRPHPLLALLLSRLLPTLWALAADNPVPLAYILYFSPYIAQAAGFLLPLILTTALLAAASAVPTLVLLLPPSSEVLQDEKSPTVVQEDVCDGHDAVAAGSSLCTGLEAEEEESCGGVEYSGFLGTLWWEIQGLCVDPDTQPFGYKEVDVDDDGSLSAQQQQVQQQQQQNVGDGEPALSSPAKRDNGAEGEDRVGEKAGGEGGGGPQKDAPSPNPTTTTRAAGMITWQEFEAIGKLYQALTQDMPHGLPIKLAAAASVRAKVDGAADKPSLVLHQSTQPNLPAAASNKGEGGNPAQLSRCHSRASPLEGWETPWGSELDGNDGDDEEEEFFSSTQGLMVPLRSESMNWSRAGGGGPAAALARFGGSVREGQWRRDTMLACKSVSVPDGLWARSRSVAAGVDDEGMDMLWEEYDDNGGKEGRSNWGGCEKIAGNKEKNKKKTKFSRWGSKAERRHDDDGVKHGDFPGVVEEENVDDADDFDNDSEMGGASKLCCLQALRFSTGRMRFGMGKLGTGLARASRAIKGTTLAALHRHQHTHAHGSSSSPAGHHHHRKAGGVHRKGWP